jgi:hypothetical protein
VSTSFAGTIKPYFTAYFRAHMLNFSANFDLWDPKVVEAAWPAIYNQISGGSMPTPLTPPATYAGTWDNLTQAQFLIDFQAWKTDGYPP